MSGTRVGFLLGSPAISGGTNVIFEHGINVQKLGCRVSMITRKTVDPGEYAWHGNADELAWLTMQQAARLDFDLVFATWWQSPFLLPELTARHYAYFVQSIESRFFDDADPGHHDKRDLDIWREYCERTYSLKVPIITEAHWIEKYLFERYNTNAFVVRNGIRKEMYLKSNAPVAEREPGKIRVLVEGPVDVSYKNVPATIALCLRAKVDEIWLLTSSDIDSFDGVDRVFSRVPIAETPAIYRSCDVLVKLSYVEGMFGPPLEIFHCGGTAIVYEVTGHDEYIVHNENGYVVKRDDEQQVVEYLVQLKNNPAELKRLKDGARKTADTWPDWFDASRNFFAVIQAILEMPPTSRAYLQRWTETCNREKKEKIKSREVEIFLAREEKGGDVAINNFVQVYYWAEQHGLDADLCTEAHYSSGKPVEVTLTIPMTGFPFWIRVDPSVRIGVVELFSIYVRNKEDGETLLSLTTPQDFNRLLVGGTMRKLSDTKRVLFFSHGDDPQLILPAINTGVRGQQLEITVSLKETGVQTILNAELNTSCNKRDTNFSTLHFWEKAKKRIKHLLPGE